MVVKYYSKNYKITDKFKELIEKKLGRMAKYFAKDYDVKVNCIKENNDERLEITINADGLFLRSEVISGDMYENIDNALPKIEKQIVKNHEKYKSKFKNVTNAYEFLTEAPKMDVAKVVKRKRFELEPIMVEDAEAQMEALGHTFFTFLNAETGLVSVLYKRNDGHLGLIELTF